ncbi:uncharacterized protein [Hemitrygon akajei]|uniref:uncharacterized protein n=1 Tax=Hemitrygon akajei TaxID=2704970 RepID=UPI003BF94445
MSWHSDVESWINANSLQASARPNDSRILTPSRRTSLTVKTNSSANCYPAGKASSDNGCISILSSETQRILDRMDDSETYMNKKPTKTGSLAPSRDHQTSTYTELNIRKGDRLTNTQTDGLDPTYSQLNFRQNELPVAKDEDPPIASRPGEMPVTAQADGLDHTYSLLNLRHNGLLVAKDEDPPIASGPGEMPMTAQAGQHKQEPKENIGITPCYKICLLSLFTFVLFAIVVGLSIHVSQIRQSKITSDGNYHKINSTLQSKLSALNSNLSDLKRMHSDLRHQFTEMETKYRSVNETKAQICELLTSRREQTCSQDWIKNKGLCYFISTFESSYEGAKQLCSISDSKLLEINSNEEENFVNNRIRDHDSSYWIGTCKAGKVASNVVYKVKSGKFECGECKSSWLVSCKDDQHRFICEKPAPLCPDIPEKIRDLCQKPVEPT